MNPSKENIKADFIYNTSAAKSDRELYRICPSKLTKHELEDLYFSLLEANANLQKTVSGQQERIKMLSSKMQRMITAQKVHLADERKNCCFPSSCVVNQYKQTILEMRRNNERMAERIRQLNIKLCSAKHLGKPFQLTTTRDSTATPANSPCSAKEMSVESVEIQTEPINDNDQACDKNKCKTHIDELKQKIVSLEQLSNTHNECSNRISRLEAEVQRCCFEMLPVCSQRVTNEQGLQGEKLINLPADNIGAGDDDLVKLKTQLLLEQQKVANLEAELIAEKLFSAATSTLENRLTNIQEKAIEDDIERDSFSWICNCSPVCPDSSPTAKHMCTALHPYNNALSSGNQNVFEYCRGITMSNKADNLKYDDVDRKQDSNKRINASDSSKHRNATEDDKHAPVVNKRDEVAEGALKGIQDDINRTSAAIAGWREDGTGASKRNHSLDDSKRKHASEDIWHKHVLENNKRKDTTDEYKRKRGYDDIGCKNAPDHNKRNSVSDGNKRKQRYDDIGRKNASDNSKSKDSPIIKKRDNTPDNKRKNSLHEVRNKKRINARDDNKRDDTPDNIRRKDPSDDHKRRNITVDSRKDAPANTRKGTPELISRVDTLDEKRRNCALDDNRPNNALDANIRKDVPDDIERNIIPEDERQTYSLYADEHKDPAEDYKRKSTTEDNSRKDASDADMHKGTPDYIGHIAEPDENTRNYVLDKRSNNVPDDNVRKIIPDDKCRTNSLDDDRRKYVPNNNMYKDASNCKYKDTPGINKRIVAPNDNKLEDDILETLKNIGRKDLPDDCKRKCATESSSHKNALDAKDARDCYRSKNAPVATNYRDAPIDCKQEDTRDNIRCKNPLDDHERKAVTEDDVRKDASDAYTHKDSPDLIKRIAPPNENRRNYVYDDIRPKDASENTMRKDLPDDVTRKIIPDVKCRKSSLDDKRKDALDINKCEDASYNRWRKDASDGNECKEPLVPNEYDDTSGINKPRNAFYDISDELAPVTYVHNDAPDNNVLDYNKYTGSPDDNKRKGPTGDNTLKSAPDDYRHEDAPDNNLRIDVPDSFRLKNVPDDILLKDTLDDRKGIHTPDVKKREDVMDGRCTDVSHDGMRVYTCSDNNREDTRDNNYKYSEIYSPNNNIDHMCQDSNLQEYPYADRNQALSTRDLNTNENKNVSDMDRILDLHDYYWTEDAAAAKKAQDLANNITDPDIPDGYESRNLPRTEVAQNLLDSEEIQDQYSTENNIKEGGLFYDADAYRPNVNKAVANVGMDRTTYLPDVDIRHDRFDSNRLQPQSDGETSSISKDIPGINVEGVEISQPSSKKSNTNGLKLISPKHDRHNSLQIPGPIPVSETIQRSTWKTNVNRGSNRDSNSKEKKAKNKDPSNDTGLQKGKAVMETSTVTEGKFFSTGANDKYVCKADQMTATDMQSTMIEAATSDNSIITPRRPLSSFEMKDVAIMPMDIIPFQSDFSMEPNLAERVDTVEKETQVGPQLEGFARRRVSKDGDVPIPTQREIMTYRNKDGTLCFKTTPASERYHCCPCDKHAPCGGARNKSVQSEVEIPQHVNTVEQGTGTPYRSEMTRSTSPDITVPNVHVPFTRQQPEEIPPTSQGSPQPFDYKTVSTQTIDGSIAALSNIDMISKEEFLPIAAIPRMENYDKRNEVIGTMTPEVLTMQKMEKTLQVLAAELARCKELLLSQQPGENCVKKQDSGGIDEWDDSRQHVLKPGKASHTIGDTYAPRCMFTLHIGTVVLSDEAVLNTRDRSLVLTWKFYDQNMSMTRMRAGRVMLFDVSTEYDIKITDEFLNYMKHEEMVIVVCEMYNEKEPFATCALPLRHALLHTNRRADMSLALMAGPQMLCARTMNKKSSDSLDAGDEMGVIDLWCMLHVDPKLVPAINRAISRTTPSLKKPRQTNMLKHNIFDNDEAESCDVDITLSKLQKRLDRSYQDLRNRHNDGTRWGSSILRLSSKDTSELEYDDEALLQPGNGIYDKHMSPLKRQDSSVLLLPSTVPVDQGAPTKLVKKYQYRRDSKQKKQPGILTQAPSVSPTAPLDLSNYPSTSRNSIPKAQTIESMELLDHNNNQYRRDSKARKQPGTSTQDSSMNTSPVLDHNKYPLSSGRNSVSKPQKMDPIELLDEDHVPGGILINEVVANIKTPDDMKHAMEKTNRNSLHNVARLPKVEDDLISQTYSSMSSHRSVARLLERGKKDLSKTNLKYNKRGPPSKLRRADDIFQPAMLLQDDHSEASELYRKYENISKFFASKPDTSKKQVTIKSVEDDEDDEKDPQKEATLSSALKKEDLTVDITILWLALNEECEAMCNPRVQRVYVSYTFLGRSGADMETPFSLPKPRHHVDKCYFNFKKKFHLGSEDIVLLGHMAQCRAASKVSADFKECVVFSVISEPPEDPLGLETCEDIGYAYLYLGDLLAYSAGSSGYTEVIPVTARGGASVCGVLAIRVDGLEVLRRCVELAASETVPPILE